MARLASLVPALPAQPLPRAAVLFHRCALVLALVSVLLLALSRSGAIGWRHLQSLVGEPWSGLLEKEVGEKTLLLIGGQGFGFLGYSFLVWCLTHSSIQHLVGKGTVVMVKRLAPFAGLPVAVAAYLLLNLDRSVSAAAPFDRIIDPDRGPRLAIAFLLYEGDEGIVLTVPVLVSTVLFGSAALLCASPLAGHRRRWIGMATVATAPIVAAGLVHALDRVIADQARPWHAYNYHVRIVEIALFAVAVAYVLIAVEALLADADDVRRHWSGGRRLTGSLALVRAGGRLSAFLVPVLVGAWLAVGYTPPAASIVVDREGRFLELRRGIAGPISIRVNDNEVAPVMRDAMLAAEDPGLADPRTHAPIDPVRLVGALQGIAAMLNDQGGVSGASGIAAQSCKLWSGQPISGRIKATNTWSLLADYGGRAVEKLYEMPCAWTFEKVALWRNKPHQSPLTTYLNAATFLYVGREQLDGSVVEYELRGVGAAAWIVFGKVAGELSLVEAATLGGMPNRPGDLNPWINPDLVIKRRNHILDSMVRLGYSVKEVEAAKTEPLGVRQEPLIPPIYASYFTEHAMGEAGRLGYYGFSKAGWTVQTTLNRPEQKALEAAVDLAVSSQASGNVTDGAAMVVDPMSGEIRAYVGGLRPRSGESAGIDLITDQPFQPGSAIKPLVYACALEYGVLDPVEEIEDSRALGALLGVGNHDGEFWGSMPAADALATSRNVPAAVLVQRMTPQGFEDCLRIIFQVETDLDAEQMGVHLGLGLAEMKAAELARAYAVLANGGESVQLESLLRIRDRDGREQYALAPGPRQRVLRCDTAEWLTQVLYGVSHQLELVPVISSKTGSTSATSVIAGYSPGNWVLVGWVGHAEPKQALQAIDPDVAFAGRILQEMANGYYATRGARASNPCDDSAFHSALPPVQRQPAMAATVPVLAFPGVGVDGEGASVDPATLEGFLAELQEHGYESVTPRDLVAALDANRPLPAKPVMLTMDDGQSGVPEFADLLARHNFAGTFFLSSTGGLSGQEIAHLVAVGEVCGNTVQREALTTLSGVEQKREIEANKAWLQAVVGEAITCFAYPPRSSTRESRDLVAAAGYRIGFDTGSELARLDSQLDRWHVPRIAVDSSWGVPDLIDLVDGS